MEHEQEYGNVEYKLKLSDTSKERIERLASQMRFRCNEGNSECIYNIGVEDDGTMTGLTEDEFNNTLLCLKKAAEINQYSITLICKSPTCESKALYDFLIRETNNNSYIDIKVAIAGSVDCGKSTLLSVLVSGKSDNGRGSGRLSVFNFPHEVESGRTSSIGHQIVGYDIDGSIMNYAHGRQHSWPDIVKTSSKIISFLDLAGHEKYLKTTIFGLTSAQPDLALIMISANRGILKMTLEHIFLCKTLHIPFCIVITKIDMVKDKDNVLLSTIESIYNILKKPGIRRMPLKIKDIDDVVRAALHISSESIVPIFSVSNVTLEGITNLHKFLNLVPKKSIQVNSTEVECHLNDSWTVNGVGTVFGGHLISGCIRIGDKLWFGPNNNKYVSIIVKSIQCKKVPIQSIHTQSYITIGVRGHKDIIHKTHFKRGNVLLGSSTQQILCTELIANVEVLKTHSTTIKIGYQPMMHANNVKCCVTINKIENKICQRRNENTDEILRTGDSALVTLSLCFECKFIKENTDILLCEGKTKVIGRILKVNQLNQSPPL